MTTATTETTIVVRHPCRHGQTHPHNVDVLGTDIDNGNRWCTDGDFQVFDRTQLTHLFYDTLTSVDLRVEKDLAMTKAPQLVDALFAKIRGAV